MLYSAYLKLLHQRLRSRASCKYFQLLLPLIISMAVSESEWIMRRVMFCWIARRRPVWIAKSSAAILVKMVASKKVSSLKDYLRKYQDGNEEKKKKKKSKSENAGVIVVDEDPIWQKPVELEEQDDDFVDEKPQVDEDIEVKRMNRLEQARAKRPLGTISEDGSGWVPISDTSIMVSSSDRIPDISPSRRIREDTPSPEQKVETADLSPPRKQRARNDSPSPEPKLKPTGAAYADLSPPRKHRVRDISSSPQPEWKSSKTTIADISPPRRQNKHYLSSMSGRGTAFSSDLDDQNMINASAPYGRRARHDSPPPRPNLEPSDSGKETYDISPPRRQQRHHYTSSPEPRRKSSHSVAQDTNISPPRRGRQDNSHTSFAVDLSPVRKVRKDRSLPIDPSAPSGSLTSELNASSVLDLSPPRKIRKKSPTLKQRPKTGLVTGKDIKEEIAKTKKEDWLRFKEMDPSVSGRGAEPVYRDKVTGEQMSKDEFLKSQKKKEEKPKEVKLEWGKGLAQKREAEARLEELERGKEKPFARSRDDPELDKMLKERLRWGDPMAHLVKKKHLEPVLPDLGDNEKMKESGFIIPQEIPSHSWIRRGLDFPPNRYNIKPGRHWDGVDRSNGTEKELFKRMNEKQATQREAYLWSVSDM